MKQRSVRSDTDTAKAALRLWNDQLIHGSLIFLLRTPLEMSLNNIHKQASKEIQVKVFIDSFFNSQ